MAAGAGASLAMACDIRIAAEAASFALAFGRVGLVPDSGATWFLPRLVGATRAAELALLGDPVTAADAVRLGLVGRVVPADQLADGGEIRRCPARRGRAARDRADEAGAQRGVGPGPRGGARATRRSSRTWPAARRTTPRGMAAFLEKRPPRFTGE